MVATISNILHDYTEDTEAKPRLSELRKTLISPRLKSTQTECVRRIESLQGSSLSLRTQQQRSGRGAVLCLTFALLVLYVHILIFTLDFPGTARSPNGVLKQPTFSPDEKVLSCDAAEQFKLQPAVRSVTVKLMCHGVCVCVCRS